MEALPSVLLDVVLVLQASFVFFTWSTLYQPPECHRRYCHNATLSKICGSTRPTTVLEQYRKWRNARVLYLGPASLLAQRSGVFAYGKNPPFKQGILGLCQQSPSPRSSSSSHRGWIIIANQQPRVQYYRIPCADLLTYNIIRFHAVQCWSVHTFIRRQASNNSA